MKNIKEISKILNKLNSANEISNFLEEILTKNELEILSKRWRILKMLSQGKTQREIASSLNVGLCKVTRGAKILKNKNAITTIFLTKETENETN